MAYPSRPERLVMRGLGIGCELRDLDERSRFFWLRTGNMDHANAARMVGEKHNVTLERNDFRLEHVRHPSFWKDDHVATLERNGLRLEVVGTAACSPIRAASRARQGDHTRLRAARVGSCR